MAANAKVRRALTAAAILPVIMLQAMAEQQSNRELASKVEGALAAGKTEDAREAVTEILGRPHVELEILLETGVRLAERDFFAPAAEVFSRTVREYPENFEARYNLALADFALGRFPEAQAALGKNEPASREQQLAKAYMNGKIHAALGQNDLAERDLTRAFNGAPNQENYALDLGLYYVQRRLYAKAVATLDAGVKRHPDSIYLTLGLALAQLFGDDPPRAVATCRRLLAMDANFGPARLLLA